MDENLTFWISFWHTSFSHPPAHLTLLSSAISAPQSTCDDIGEVSLRGLEICDNFLKLDFF
jgi:hypothetical protein